MAKLDLSRVDKIYLFTRLLRLKNVQRQLKQTPCYKKIKSFSNITPNKQKGIQKLYKKTYSSAFLRANYDLNYTPSYKKIKTLSNLITNKQKGIQKLYKKTYS